MTLKPTHAYHGIPVAVTFRRLVAGGVAAEATVTDPGRSPWTVTRFTVDESTLESLPIDRCPDCDGDGVVGTSAGSPPCGTCEPELRAAWLARQTDDDLYLARAEGRIDTAEARGEEFRRVLDTDDGGEPEGGPVATFDVEPPKRLRTLGDTDDGIDEAGWDRKVRELPAWDRCEGDGGSGVVDALDLSDPAKAPFGREWRLGLVAEEDAHLPLCTCDRCMKNKAGWTDLPTAHRPPALVGDEKGTDPTAAVQTPAERHQGAVDHQEGVVLGDGRTRSRQAHPARPLSETCAALASMGLMDPREVVSIASVEEHAERWHGDKIDASPMKHRTVTKAVKRVRANVLAWWGRRLEVTS